MEINGVKSRKDSPVAQCRIEPSRRSQTEKRSCRSRSLVDARDARYGRESHTERGRRRCRSRVTGRENRDDNSGRKGLPRPLAREGLEIKRQRVFFFMIDREKYGVGIFNFAVEKSRRRRDDAAPGAVVSGTGGGRRWRRQWGRKSVKTIRIVRGFAGALRRVIYYLYK